MVSLFRYAIKEQITEFIVLLRYYTWSGTPVEGAAELGFEFVPQLWGWDIVDQWESLVSSTFSALSTDAPKYLLGCNECVVILLVDSSSFANSDSDRTKQVNPTWTSTLVFPYGRHTWSLSLPRDISLEPVPLHPTLTV